MEKQRRDARETDRLSQEGIIELGSRAVIMAHRRLSSGVAQANLPAHAQARLR